MKSSHASVREAHFQPDLCQQGMHTHFTQTENIWKTYFKLNYVGVFVYF